MPSKPHVVAAVRHVVVVGYRGSWMCRRDVAAWLRACRRRADSRAWLRLRVTQVRWLLEDQL